MKMFLDIFLFKNYDKMEVIGIEYVCIIADEDGNYIGESGITNNKNNSLVIGHPSHRTIRDK